MSAGSRGADGEHRSSHSSSTGGRGAGHGGARPLHPQDPDREVPLNIEIVCQPLSGSRLARDYLNGEGSAGSFFHGSPTRLADLRDKLHEVQGRFGPEERARVGRALRPTSPGARARLDRFLAQGGAVVTTGQQAGLFTGPLYTVYKALSVLRLADDLEARLGIPVVPVFWIASEDHDWAEVNHAYLAASGDGLHRLALPDGDPRPLPMSVRTLDDGVRGILDEAEQLLAGTAHGTSCLKWIRDAYRPGRSVAEAFGALLAELFAELDLCLVDAADPELKRATVPVLRQALEGAAEQEAVLRERSEALQAAGYHAQVAVMEGATNVFHHGGGTRERLYRTRTGFATREGGGDADRAALLARLEEAPEEFSPNVFLRPIVESAFFPTLAYVAGPGEIAYFAQLSALFPVFGISPPVVYPRFSATLVEPGLRRLLEKLGLEREELAEPRHELVSRLARRAVPAEVRAGLEAAGSGISEGYRRLIEAAVAIDPTLAGSLGALRNQALATLGASERKIVQRVKDRERVVIGQLDRVRAHLRPEGEPQERVLNVLPFVARHGPELLRALAGAVRVEWADAE